MAVVGHNGGPQDSDWIRAYRSLRTHPVVGFLNPDGTVRRGKVVCETMAWLDLCMEANWRDRQVTNRGKVVLIERGQLLGARRWLSARWGWTEDKVRHFLTRLQADGMINLEGVKKEKIAPETRGNDTQSNTQKRAHFANTITICNYNIYQTVCELDEALSTQKKPQTTPKQPPHLKKERKDISPNGDSSPKQGDLLPPAEPVASEKPKQIEAIEAARIVARAWNEMAGRCGLAKIEKLTTTRGAAICRRILDAGSLEKFLAVMARIERTPWMLGENDRGWRADFDFILQPSSFTKLMEGAYERGKRSGTSYSANGAYMGALL